MENSKQTLFNFLFVNNNAFFEQKQIASKLIFESCWNIYIYIYLPRIIGVGQEPIIDFDDCALCVFDQHLFLVSDYSHFELYATT